MYPPAAGPPVYPAAGPHFYVAGPQAYQAAGPHAYPAAGPHAYPAPGPQAYLAAGPHAYPAPGPHAYPAPGPHAYPAAVPPVYPAAVPQAFYNNYGYNHGGYPPNTPPPHSPAFAAAPPASGFSTTHAALAPSPSGPASSMQLAPSMQPAPSTQPSPGRTTGPAGRVVLGPAFQSMEDFWEAVRRRQVIDGAVLDSYAMLLREAGVTPAGLRDLDDRSLEELGVPTYFHRRLLLAVVSPTAGR